MRVVVGVAYAPSACFEDRFIGKGIVHYSARPVARALNEARKHKICNGLVYPDVTAGDVSAHCGPGPLPTVGPVPLVPSAWEQSRGL